MKITEAKEKLPLDFLTTTVSHSWEEVGNLKANIAGINQAFSGTDKVEKILQDLVDAYLICIGQLELFLDKKEYLDLPAEEKLTENSQADIKFILRESNEADAEPFEAKKFEDNNKTEIFTDLPDYHVEVEQKGDKIEIELEPQETHDPEFSKAETMPDNENDSFDYFTDFEEPEYDASATAEIKAWLTK